ncbi:MAG: HD-GYP domain-containing protein [Agarilytica sp.]
MANIKKIHVDQLRTGMVVAKLDRDWLDTPFMMQGFRIEDTDDARVVAQYCEHVWIDTDLSRGSATASGEGTVTSAPPLPQPQCPVEEEHARIQEAFKGSRVRTRDLHDDIRLGQSIDSDAVRETVDDCVTSVLRNPDALLWMSKIREESEYTAEHSLNVCILAVVFGRHLGYGQSDLEKLGLCGLLHDIGKMRVPLEILEKPGKLTTKEMNMMKAHTVHGRNLLLSTPSIDPIVIDAAYSHHERIDGAGYPRKMPAEKISRFSRIISIVDTYDAITADRCYSKARPSTVALKIIYEERGKQFDDELALQFIKAIGLFPVGSVVELYSGEIAIVVETNQLRRHLPRVVIVLDRAHKEKEHHKIVDLLHIEEGDLSSDFLIKKVLPDGEFGVYLRAYQEKGVLLNY